MKEKITLRNILIASAVVLGLIAFFLSFGSGLIIENGSCEITGLVIGTQYKIVDGAKTKVPSAAAIYADGTIFGVLLLLICPIIALLLKNLKVNPKIIKYVLIGLSLFILAGAILFFCLKDTYIAATVNKNVAEQVKQGVDVTDEMVLKLRDAMYEGMEDTKLNGLAVLPGILGILQVIAVVGSQFIPDKKLIQE